MKASEPLLVEVTRSGLAESVHLVDVAVVRPDGTLEAGAGDPGVVAYLRSTAKPIQATVCLESGWRPSSDAHIAVACASHNGEPAHLDAVRGILASAGLGEDALRCPGPVPIAHNCSGKHAAMLAACVTNGWPPDDYRSADHPLQRAVALRIEGLAGNAPRAVGVDGCGVPTFAFTIAEAARTFALLEAEAPGALEAMRAHPFLVGGTRRLCTAVLSALPEVVIKIGAEGILCGLIRGRGLGFALKVRDGSARAREPAAVALLRMLGAFDDPPTELVGFGAPEVTGGGAPVGAVGVRGKLHRA